MRRLLFTLLLAAPLVTTACEDPFGPGDWGPGAAEPDTVEIYSLSRVDLIGLPSAFDFTPNGFGRVVVESPGVSGNWDMALTEQGGELVLMPPGVIETVETTAGITLSQTPFDQLREAPRSRSVYNDSTVVPIREGQVYIVRSRQVRNPFFGSCVYFAKVEAIRVDLDEGSFLFRFIANPNCNDPALVPPND